MFVRFQQAGDRLQVSLVETRRVDGGVRHEHIASLGSIVVPHSIEGRLAFWQDLHQRLGQLSNQVDAGVQVRVLGSIHARVPMVTADEWREAQLSAVEANARFWAGIRDMNQATADDHRGLVEVAEGAIARMRSAAADAGAKAAAARERAECIRRGEDVSGGIDRPLTRDDFHKAGFTAADLRWPEWLGSVPIDVVEETNREFMRRDEGRRRRGLRAAVRAVLARRGGG